jgi:ribosome-associated toxin RatA of RatAB toxin-antitoxin module
MQTEQITTNNEYAVTNAQDDELELTDLSTDGAELEKLAELEANSDAATPDPDLLKLVEIWTSPPQGRQRQLSARITIDHPPTCVWQVLTDYEALPEFVPNLQKSQRLPHPTGGIRIEQVGAQRFIRLKFSARVVLDVEEEFPRQLQFTMVEGDFKSFSGSWQLSSLESNPQRTDLLYTLQVVPKRTMPVGLVAKRLRRDLPLNLLAIRQRVNSLFGSS